MMACREQHNLGCEHGLCACDALAMLTQPASLPPDPCSHLEECVTADDDPRVALRGQKRALFTRSLSKGTVLGPYAAYMLLKEEFHKLKFDSMPDNFLGELRGSRAAACLGWHMRCWQPVYVARAKDVPGASKGS